MSVKQMSAEDFRALEAGKTIVLRYGNVMVFRRGGNFVFRGPSGTHEMRGVQDHERVDAHLRHFIAANKSTGERA